MTIPEYFRTDPETDPVVTASKDAEARLVFQAAAHIAGQSGPVLILGEPGTGRGAVARKVHALGSSAAGPMLEVDCCDLDSVRCVQRAGRGTVYLREVEDMHPDQQEELAQLLDADQSDPRIIVSGSPGLAGLALGDEFSRALLATLSRVSLRIPPLRDRPLDVPDLVGFMLDRYSAERGAPVRLAEAAMGYLIEYDWPGNIAELEHVIERLCEAGEGEFASADALPPQIRWFPGRRGAHGARSKSEVGFNPLNEEFQFRLIADALRRTQRR